MANSSVETVNGVSNRILLTLGVLLVVAGIAAFYLLDMYAWYIRSTTLAVSIVAAIAVELVSASGQSFIKFVKDSYRELNKIVWPTSKEASQTTLVVFGFVFLMSIYLWVSDKTIEWVIFSLILGWR
ncbi:preprotein translocase subunit SecE [Candidatus Vallotia cooleyia]|uniref:preprotein translocase subunit SecE n=1 Tax=Candidatus Vallotiella adelgis TaxID=1177211 RepID=UPI001D016E87|nr:preprotein translocase subunit SecE [Candidatus Vallotia cooleyia]UDG81840.1 Protein translocase subunit SecE [Candidatus Vallotia cooleyia]